MCGRYYRRSDKQRIAEAFGLGELGDLVLEENYNVAPSTFQPVIRVGRETDERELVLMRWGLVPFFAKSLEAFKGFSTGFSTINARAETVATSGTFRVPFQRRRCLVPVDGFYEWKTTTLEPEAGARSKKPKVVKEPFAFSMKDGRPFALAGLWDAWKEPDGGWLQSFSIVTTEANAVMAPVHTRMPVIVHERDYGEWLARGDDVRPPVHLLRVFEAEGMRRDACNPLVGNVRNNGAEMLNSA
jgi:putative SOS response-associated peptidase YedK